MGPEVCSRSQSTKNEIAYRCCFLGSSSVLQLFSEAIIWSQLSFQHLRPAMKSGSMSRCALLLLHLVPWCWIHSHSVVTLVLMILVHMVNSVNMPPQSRAGVCRRRMGACIERGEDHTSRRTRYRPEILRKSRCPAGWQCMQSFRECHKNWVELCYTVDSCDAGAQIPHGLVWQPTSSSRSKGFGPEIPAGPCRTNDSLYKALQVRNAFCICFAPLGICGCSRFRHSIDSRS